MCVVQEDERGPRFFVLIRDAHTQTHTQSDPKKSAGVEDDEAAKRTKKSRRRWLLLLDTRRKEGEGLFAKPLPPSFPDISRLEGHHRPCKHSAPLFPFLFSLSSMGPSCPVSLTDSIPVVVVLTDNVCVYGEQQMKTGHTQTNTHL